MAALADSLRAAFGVVTGIYHWTNQNVVTAMRHGMLALSWFGRWLASGWSADQVLLAVPTCGEPIGLDGVKQPLRQTVPRWVETCWTNHASPDVRGVCFDVGKL